MTKKTKAHTRYESKNGTYIPGVTTVTRVMAKPALIYWANKLGLEGTDVRKYVDELAEIGTCTHYIIECKLTDEIPDFKDFTPEQVRQARVAVKKFYAWEDDNAFSPIKVELQLVSEKHKFGGTCDIYADLNGKKTLIDIKTGNAVYDEYFTQVAAYKALLEENNYPVEDVRILRIGRNENEGFDDRKVPLLEEHWQRFLHCLAIYNLNKKLKPNGR